jgi:hypothetical protein
MQITDTTIETEKINQDLKQHQVGTKEWDYRNVTESLHLWSERFILEFKLQTSMPAIQIERLKQDRYGHFRYGRNGFGLRNEIAIDKDHIQQDEYWTVLGTLLHEMLHSEQQNIGKPGRRNYHNKEYKDKARSLGLLVDERGCQQYTPAPSPFLDLLKKCGVDAPEIPVCKDLVSYREKSKLRLWICECKPKPVHVRVAVKDLQARCLRCGQLFVPK